MKLPIKQLKPDAVAEVESGCLKTDESYRVQATEGE